MTDREQARPGAGRGIAVRELRADDRAVWEELWAGYLRFADTKLPQEITELNWRRLMDLTTSPYGLLAVDGDRVIGFVHYHFHPTTWSANGKCYLEDLYVEPTVRSRGAGRALIEAVYQAGDARGIHEVYWHTRASNAQARALYDKLATLTEFVRYSRQPRSFR
jgi:ribosomal protein S18 acetylase RimI-like enzyme